MTRASWVAAVGAFAAIALGLGAAIDRAGANLNLPAPLIGALPAAEAPAPARRAPVLLVVIDGLRADLARSLPFLDELGRTGVRVRLRADPPTYSAAQYVAMLTGVPPRDSGVRTNEGIRAAGIDDVARRVREAGGRAAVLSTEVDWWARLFPGSFDDARVIPAARIVVEAQRLAPPHADLLVVHLCDVDTAGHRFGAAAPQYLEAARAADRLTAALARGWGWPRANVVVTADHGHRKRGGHGGDELDVSESFLVAAGPGVEPGAQAEGARSVDLAPTLAAWLGVAPPAQASGRALVALLHAAPQVRATLAADDDRRRARVSAATAQARAAAREVQARGRWLRVVPAGAGLAAMVWLALRRWRAFLRGLLGMGAAIGLFGLIFGPVSFSAARKAIVWGAGIALLSFAAASIALVARGRRRAGDPERRPSHDDGPGAAAVVAGFAPPALAAFVHSGLFTSRLDCEPGWVAAGPAFAYLTLAAACVAAALVTIGAWVSLALAAQRGKSVG
ncbi:MAG TPA: alkaline phosphatase family protein [Polyangia bacterium]|jgi:hypothetical protein|nr:alkaline phosphatase family protein [Polyangia bacterium]